MPFGGYGGQRITEVKSTVKTRQLVNGYMETPSPKPYAFAMLPDFLKFHLKG